MDILKGSEQEMGMNGQDVAKITKSMVIHGDIAVQGSILIEGNIIGNMQVNGKTNITGEVLGDVEAEEINTKSARITGKVVSKGVAEIGVDTVICGDIAAKSLNVYGAVKGNTDVKGPVKLESSAIVLGDVKSESIQISYGAVLEGKCSQCYASVNPKNFFKDIEKKSNKKSD